MREASVIRFSGSVENEKQELCRELAEFRLPKDIYMITVPEEPTHLLNIIHGALLAENYYRESRETVVGMAKGYEEARELAASILSDLYAETGKFETADLAGDGRPEV